MGVSEGMRLYSQLEEQNQLKNDEKDQVSEVQGKQESSKGKTEDQAKEEANDAEVKVFCF